MAEEVSPVQGVFPVWLCFLHDCLIELKAGSQSQPAGSLDGRLFPCGQCGSATDVYHTTSSSSDIHIRG